MKRRAKFTGRVALIYREMVCPFCKAITTENPTMPWCATCAVEYTISRSGRITFDDQRKTPAYAFGKALNLAGGIRIGKART